MSRVKSDTANAVTVYIITYRFVDGHANQQVKVARIIPKWSHYANVAFRFFSRAPSRFRLRKGEKAGATSTRMCIRQQQIRRTKRCSALSVSQQTWRMAIVHSFYI